MSFCSEEVALKNIKLHTMDTENSGHAECGSTASSMRRRRGCIDSRDRNPPLEWETAIRNLNMMQLENRERLNGSLQREGSMRSITSQGVHLFNSSLAIISHDMSEACSPMPRDPASNLRPLQSGRDGSTVQGSLMPRDGTISTALEKKELIQSGDLVDNINNSKPSCASLQPKRCASPHAERISHSLPTQPGIYAENNSIGTPNRDSMSHRKMSPRSSLRVTRVMTPRHRMSDAGQAPDIRVATTSDGSAGYVEDSTKVRVRASTDVVGCSASMQPRGGGSNLGCHTTPDRKLDPRVEKVPTPTPRAKVARGSQSPFMDPVMRKLDPIIAAIPALICKPDSLVVSPCSTSTALNSDKKSKHSSLKRESVGPRKESRAVSTVKYGITPRRTGATSAGISRRTPRTCGEEKRKPILPNSAASISTSNNISGVSGSYSSDHKTVSTQNTIKNIINAPLRAVENTIDHNLTGLMLTVEPTPNAETAKSCKPQISSTQSKMSSTTLVHHKNIASSPRGPTKIVNEEFNFPEKLSIGDATSDKKQSVHTSVQRRQKAPLIYRTTAVAEQRRMDSLRVRCDRKKEEEEKVNTLAPRHANYTVLRPDKWLGTREGGVTVPAKRPSQSPSHTTLVIQPPTSHATTQKKSCVAVKVTEATSNRNKEASSTYQCVSNPHNNTYLDPHGLLRKEGKYSENLTIERTGRTTGRRTTAEAVILGDGEAAEPARTPRGRTPVPFCILCGKRHISETAKFCAFCGHEREVI